MANQTFTTAISLIAGIALATVPVPCSAGDMPFEALQGIGFRVAAVADFVGTPHFQQRATSPTGWLAVTADFNGDGTFDEARLLLNGDRKTAYVVATILTAKLDTYVLKIVPLSEAEDIGIKLASNAPLNGGRPSKSSLTVFSFDGGAEDYSFNGDEFNHHPVASPIIAKTERTAGRK